MEGAASLNEEYNTEEEVLHSLGPLERLEIRIVENHSAKSIEEVTTILTNSLSQPTRVRAD